VLTISRLSRWSINYYNDTARQATQAGPDRRRANGGLGEYYSEGDTRTPTWLIVADTALRLSRALGLSDMFFINMQAHYDAEIAREHIGSQLATIERIA